MCHFVFNTMLCPDKIFWLIIRTNKMLFLIFIF